MPFSRKETDLASDMRMHRLTDKYRNGTRREVVTPDMVESYGARLRARMSPKTIVGKEDIKETFSFEAPARDSKLGAYKEVGMIRGRSKSAYNIITGKGEVGKKRMVLTAPDSGQPAGVSDYVTTQQMQGLGQATVSAEALWRRDLDDFSKDIQGMHMFTTNSQEIRYYQKGQTLVENGKKIFANNPQMLAAIAPIEGELGRWRDHRAWALTQQQGTENRVSIGKIQDRMINALNYARTAMGIAAIPGGNIIPEMNIPDGQLPNIPGAPGTPKPPAPAQPVPTTPSEKALAPKSWLQKNKTLVGGAALLTLLIGGYVWVQRRG
ncbi:MAG: hypothetical protein GF375_02360 [Candidatus Omnitrophica bacterium]|nr:hypothetical protein [Candidatus Omnitrophota bacterium]